MANKSKKGIGNIIILCVLAVLLVGLIVGDALCGLNSEAITLLLCGDGLSFEGDEVTQATAVSDGLVQNIADEGIILLKNDNETLPLAETNRKVNLFGWASTDKGFLYTGVGSGAANIVESVKVSPQKAFEDAGFQINTSLMNAYTSWKNTASGGADKITEAPKSIYTNEIITEAKAFSDTAIVFIARKAGENVGEFTVEQLRLSQDEKDMLEIVTTNFDKVIVLFNTCNPMEMGFIEDGKIDAALYLGVLGQSGTRAIPKILSGAVNPSAKTTNIHPYDNTTNPALVDNSYQYYMESVYVGYKWYETAAHEGYYDSVSNDYGTGYDGVVQFPFGYGLSYTEFEWEVTSVSSENQTITDRNAEITVEVQVTNVGDVAGKDVVEVYFTAPYGNQTTNGSTIEKPYVSLVEFEKTALLEPNQTQTLTIKFDLYDLASYDCYDKNNNNAAIWELDAGQYSIKLMNNSHELDDCEKAETTFTLSNTILYRRGVSGAIRNRFTGDTAYGGVPIDGNSNGSTITYLSRADFAGTFPKATPSGRTNTSGGANYYYDGYNNVAMPTTDVDSGMYLYTNEDGSKASLASLTNRTGVKINEDLATKLSNYKAPEWDAFLNQLSKAEMKKLVELSGFGVKALESIGLIATVDKDGPSGFQGAYGSVGDTGMPCAGFPGETVLAATWNKYLAYQMGKAVANEANAVGINGWYAPAMDIQRNVRNGRNFEQYSEDPMLSGYMAANVVKGGKSLNMYCYIKHFVCSQRGNNPQGLQIWLTEQTLREVYLKPFEIAVKEGGANAVMSSFNRLGATWTGANHSLLNGVLRDEWGFRGVVLTDWSSGGGSMITTQGILAGNDMWLNSTGTNVNPLDENNAAHMYCARLAVKNYVYTLCDTYNFYKNYDASAEESVFNATVGVKEKSDVFAWWIPILIAINVAYAAVVVWQVLRIFVFKKKPAATNAAKS